MHEEFEITDYQKTIVRTRLKLMFTEYENWLEMVIEMNETLRKENIELKIKLNEKTKN